MHTSITCFNYIKFNRQHYPDNLQFEKTDKIISKLVSGEFSETIKPLAFDGFYMITTNSLLSSTVYYYAQ